MWDATTTTRSKQEKRAGFYRKGVQERFNQDVKGQTFRRVRVRVAAAAGHHHLGAEAVKKLEWIEDTTQETEIRRLGRAFTPACS